MCRAPGAGRHRVRVVQRSSRRALPSLAARAGVVAYAQRRRPGAARAAFARVVRELAVASGRVRPVGGAARGGAPGAVGRADRPSRPRPAQRGLGAGLVRRLRRRGAAQRASVRRRGERSSHHRAVGAGGGEGAVATRGGRSHRLSATCRFHGLAAVSRFASLSRRPRRQRSHRSQPAAGASLQTQWSTRRARRADPRDPSNARRALATAREVRAVAHGAGAPIRTNSQRRCSTSRAAAA